MSINNTMPRFGNPDHEKLRAPNGANQTIGEFLEMGKRAMLEDLRSANQ